MRGKSRRYYQHGNMADLTAMEHGGSGIAAAVARSE